MRSFHATPKRRNPQVGITISDGDGGPREAAVFVAESLVQLMAICERHRLDTLGYFLGMAHMEANDISRDRSRENGR